MGHASPQQDRSTTSATLLALIRDYYRIRFDPCPAPEDAHAVLQADAQRLLARLP